MEGTPPPFNPESSREKIPTLEELLEACADVLDADDLAFARENHRDFDETLLYIYGKLHESDIDPDKYFAQKGIIIEFRN